MLVEQLTSALYAHYEETDSEPSFEDAIELFESAGLASAVADLIMCRLVAGMKLA